MNKVTMEGVTLAGAALQASGGACSADFRDIRMDGVLGTGLILDGNISANVLGMTCKDCNVGITARDCELDLAEVGHVPFRFN